MLRGEGVLIYAIPHLWWEIEEPEGRYGLLANVNCGRSRQTPASDPPLMLAAGRSAPLAPCYQFYWPPLVQRLLR